MLLNSIITVIVLYDVESNEDPHQSNRLHKMQLQRVNMCVYCIYLQKAFCLLAIHKQFVYAIHFTLTNESLVAWPRKLLVSANTNAQTHETSHSAQTQIKQTSMCDLLQGQSDLLVSHSYIVPKCD